MFETKVRARETIPEKIMLSRLAQSEQMREFFIQMWIQNPGLAKQGGVVVHNLLSRLERVNPEKKAPDPSLAGRLNQRGISLIELIMFIVIVSVALAGILLVMNVTTKSSADPLIHKQSLAIAESLLEEVELMPLSICDPNDVNAASAVASVDCTGGTNGANDESRLPLGPEAGEARGPVASPYDNVSDYNGFSMAGAAIQDISGNPIGGLGGYTASVVVGATGCAGIAFPNALPIAVTVTGPDNLPVVLDGCRTRYSPRSVP